MRVDNNPLDDDEEEVPGTLRYEIKRIRKIFRKPPAKEYALYFYKDPEDFGKRGPAIKVYVIFDNHAYGTAMLYQLVIDKAHLPQFEDYSVPQWALWIRENVPGILRNQVTSFFNRESDSVWTVRGIIGWHFIRSTKAQRERQNIIRHRKPAKK